MYKLWTLPESLKLDCIYLQNVSKRIWEEYTPLTDAEKQKKLNLVSQEAKELYIYYSSPKNNRKGEILRSPRKISYEKVKALEKELYDTGLLIDARALWSDNFLHIISIG